MANRGINNNYYRGGGILSIAVVKDGNIYMFRDLGDNNEVTIGAENETSDIIESRTGNFLVAQRDVTSSTTTLTASCRDIKIENMALAFGAELETRTISATPVTDEVVYGAYDGGLHYPGANILSNADSILRLTSVDSLKIQAPARANSTAYAVGDIVSNSGIAYVYTVAGTSAASPPTFPTSGGTVADGTATLKHLGPVDLVEDDDYIVTLDPGQIQITDKGDFATTLSRMPTGYAPNLLLGYTPVAATQWRMKPLTEDRQYFVRFVGQTAKGEPLHFIARYCSVQGGGDLGFINADDPMAITLEFTPTSPDGGLPVQYFQKPKTFFSD